MSEVVENCIIGECQEFLLKSVNVLQPGWRYFIDRGVSNILFNTN